jgi:hypothetical protein
MKELVKKLSKVFLVLCMSMVLMMGSAYANPLCQMNPSFIDLPCPLDSPSPICSATAESRFGRDIVSLDISVGNVGEAPGTITMQVYKDNVWQSPAENYGLVPPHDVQTSTYDRNSFDLLTFESVRGQHFQILLDNEKCRG